MRSATSSMRRSSSARSSSPEVSAPGGRYVWRGTWGGARWVCVLTLALLLFGAAFFAPAIPMDGTETSERLSEHFTRAEFACHGQRCCGHSAPVTRRLVYALESLRELASDHRGHDVPLVITSGFRCVTYNRRVGSTDDSQHPRGYAADIAKPDGISVEAFANLAQHIPGIKGIGKYEWGIHVDVRDGVRVEWDDR